MIARTHSNAVQLRRLLAQPGLIGSRAWQLSEDELFDRGDQFVDGLQKAMPELARAGRLYGEALARSAKALAQVGTAFQARG